MTNETVTCDIKTTSSRDKKYSVTLFLPDKVVDLHTGEATEDKLKDILTMVLEHYPNVRINGPRIPARGLHLHVFKIHDKGGDDRTEWSKRFIKTHKEVSNPFRNRKIYAMVNPECSVSFDTLDV